MIHQIYCTHCTHGTSALERREGELAHRMLGYSARAGSLEARHLRRFYRQIERYVYYYLPRDTPAEEKLRLTAASAPRRLISYPAVAGLQMVAQVAYRPTDTQGRPGSYFAHVLVREPRGQQPRWPQLDGPRLWGAPGWVEEDSSEIPFLLPPLGSLGQMLQGGRAAVDDGVLLSFLGAPAGGPFDDPAGTISDRWRQAGADRRKGLLADALRGFLETSTGRRESLLLVIEPSVAALVFYGILRLLPAGPLRDSISFSTFEPNTDRIGTSLAATWFYDPQRSDLRSDAYRSCGLVINTISQRRSDFRRPEAPYAQEIIGRLVGQGWEAVDACLRDLESAGARRPEDLDRLASVDRLVLRWFGGQRTALAEDWRSSPMAAGYLRRAVVRQLAGPAEPAAALAPVVGGPAHLTLLELTASEPALPGTQEAADFLLGNLPGEKIPDLLRLPGIPSEAKVDVLARYVASHLGLPPGCDSLWEDLAPAAPGRPPAAQPLLGHVLGRLDLDTLNQFYTKDAGQHSDLFLLGLLAACRQQSSARAALTQVVELAEPKAILSVFRGHGPGFFQEYPDDEPALGAKLHEMLGSLTQHVRQLPERLEVLLAGRHLLADEDQSRLSAWARLRQAVLDVGRFQDQRSGVLRQRPLEELEAACRAMAEAAARAMPAGRFDDDPQGSGRQTCLRRIGQRLLGGKSLLPPGPWQHQALWQKIAWHFESGKWPSTPLAKMAPRSRSLKSKRMMLGVLLAAIPVAVLLIASAVLSRRAPQGGVAERSAPAGQAPGGPNAAESRPVAPSASNKIAPGPGTVPSAPHKDRPRPAIPAKDNDVGPRKVKVAPRPEFDERTGLPVAKPTAQAPGETHPPSAERKQDPADARGPFETEAWKALARRFAEEHSGVFFDHQPLTEGELRIPADAIAAGEAGSRLFLGIGALYFDHATYEFGADFLTQPPVARHEVPQLAEALGFPSVYVELQARPGGPSIVLGLAPRSKAADAEAQKKALIEQVERTARMITVQLRAYQSPKASEEAKDQAFENLAKLTGIEIPPVPDEPDRTSREHLGRPEAFAAAVERYRQAVRAHEQAIASVVPTAKRAVSTADEKKRYIEREFRRYEDQLRQYNQQGLAGLRGQCRAISVLVYRAPERRDLAGAPPDQGPGGPPPAVKPRPRPETLASITGRIGVEKRPLAGLRLPAVARIKPVVARKGGQPLPPWYTEKLTTGCLIMGQNREGFLLRPTELRDIDADQASDVPAGTVAVRVRFKFFPRSAKPADPKRQAVAATDSLLIEPVEEGQQYTVRLELSEEELEWLRRFAGAGDSGRS